MSLSPLAVFFVILFASVSGFPPDGNLPELLGKVREEFAADAALSGVTIAGNLDMTQWRYIITMTQAANAPMVMRDASRIVERYFALEGSLADGADFTGKKYSVRPVEAWKKVNLIMYYPLFQYPWHQTEVLNGKEACGGFTFTWLSYLLTHEVDKNAVQETLQMLTQESKTCLALQETYEKAPGKAAKSLGMDYWIEYSRTKGFAVTRISEQEMSAAHIKVAEKGLKTGFYWLNTLKNVGGAKVAAHFTGLWVKGGFGCWYDPDQGMTSWFPMVDELIGDNTITQQFARESFLWFEVYQVTLLPDAAVAAAESFMLESSSPPKPPARFRKVKQLRPKF